MTMPRILAKAGYRGVLISNTLIIGLPIYVFSTIGKSTRIWLIVVQVFCYGFFTSLQHTSMNTPVFADVTDEEASSASSIASTMQQLSITFGIATASLLTVFFLPARFQSNPLEFIDGIHKAFYVLGGMTLLSTIVFFELKKGDGYAVSEGWTLHANLSETTCSTM